MATEIPLGYYQVTFQWGALSTLGSLPATVLGLAGDPDDFDLGWNGLLARTATILCDPVSSDWGITGAQVRVGAAGGPPYASLAFPLSVQGNQASGACTPNVSFLVQKRSFTPGRQGRGRIYLPGPNEGDVDENGNLDGGLLLALEGMCTSLDAMTVDEPGFTGWVILHPEGSPLAATPTFIAGHVAAPQVATQRRRLRR